LFPHISGKA